MDVTGLLLAWGQGDQSALEQLVPLVHDELHRLARSHLRRERPGHTLQTTALINEAYVRLIDKTVAFQNRSHFFGVAARLMRQVLVDHARGRQAAKRGGDQLRVSLSDVASMANSPAGEILALDEALNNLAAIDSRKCQVIELRYFGGLTIAETAEVLGVSHTTVEDDWKIARAWLRREMAAK
ncbi:MAG TPA: sigma-70 family RNA polymerase sigma factor [Blastocatellia bacterium]|nr:sigma-70 family RNA polymerase sigma factor [Blastocatellia bacterium]